MAHTATHYYRLELCSPTQTTNFPYSGSMHRNNDNAGYDLFMLSDYNFGENIQSQLISLETKARLVRVDEHGETDSHYWLVPRSSLFKRGLMMANSVGVIDSTYRGELKVPVVHLPGPGPETGTKDILIKQGERLFQIVAPDMGWIKEIRTVQSLPVTVRGEGGFGSTGR